MDFAQLRTSFLWLLTSPGHPTRFEICPKCSVWSNARSAVIENVPIPGRTADGRMAGNAG